MRLVLVLLAILSACSQPASDPVGFSVNAVIDGDVITVTGATGLIDGAALRCEASYQGGGEVRPDQEWIVELSVTEVVGGEFVATGDVSALPDGRNKAYCAFMPALGGQTAAVEEVYGEMGLNLEGPAVLDGGEMRQLEADSYFTKGVE